jgi:hypothetical protein
MREVSGWWKNVNVGCVVGSRGAMISGARCSFVRLRVRVSVVMSTDWSSG